MPKCCFEADGKYISKQQMVEMLPKRATNAATQSAVAIKIGLQLRFERAQWIRVYVTHGRGVAAAAMLWDSKTLITSRCIIVTDTLNVKFDSSLAPPWARSGVDEDHGQSGQAIKLFQITPYVNDFQTLDNPGCWQPVGVSKY